MVAKDSALNLHDGAYDPSVVFSQTSPVTDGNTAVAFTTTGVTIPHAVDWFSRSFTLEAWIELNDPAGTFTWHVGTTGPQWTIGVGSFSGAIPNTTAGNWLTVSGAGPGQNEVAYVVLRYDDDDAQGGALSLWLDGTKLAESFGVDGTTGIRAQDDNLSTSVLGGAGATTVAHAAWYDRALPDARIMSHASIGSNGRFNPGGGSTGGGSSGGSGAPSFTNSPPPDGTVGIAYAFQFQASGDTPLTFSLTAGGLPSGIGLGDDGFMSGTPTIAGTYTFTVGVSNPISSTSVQYTVTISPSGGGGFDPDITGFNAPDGSVGTSYSFTFVATGTTPITWSVASGSLPTGLSLNASTGVLNGTPTVQGTYNFVIKAANSISNFQLGISITISPTGVGGGGGGGPITAANFGMVGAFFSYPDASTSGEMLDIVANSGAQWHRADVFSVNADVNNHFDTSFILPLTQARGLKLLAIAGGTPSSGSATLNHGFLTALANSGVDAIEIFNEANLHGFTPTSYMAVVNDAVPVIRAANPSLPIIIGGLAIVTQWNATNSPLWWLQQMYAVNGGNPLPGDAWSWHPYCSASVAVNGSFGDQTFNSFTHTADYRAVMDSNGDTNKQIWATECGSTTSGTDSVSETEQANRCTQYVNQWASYADNTLGGNLFIYRPDDLASLQPDREGFFGLYRSDRATPKPSFIAYQNALAAL